VPEQRDWFTVDSIKLEPREQQPAQSAHQKDLETTGYDSVAYGDPKVSSSDEIDSFNFQSEQVNFTNPPKGLMEAVARMESYYSSCRWKIRKDFLSFDHIHEVCTWILENAGDKSPGALFLREDLPTNKDVFEKIKMAGVISQVDDRIKQLLSSEDSRYAADPVRLFIKREAHKAKKIGEKRWRIIWGVSLIDQIIDRLLYMPLLQQEIKNCAEIPSKPGYNFKSGGTDRFVRKYSNGSRRWVSFDAKSFDITCPAWALLAVRELNERLCITTDEHLLNRWRALSQARELASLYGSFCFSNGVVCRKVKPCIQPSGRLLTISSNCKIVVLCRFIYDIQHGKVPQPNEIVAMGDDTVQDDVDPEEFIQWMRDQCGITFTLESKPGFFEEQNFCSMEMKRLSTGVFVPVPLNWNKNSYELANPEARVAKNEDRLIENRASCLQSLCIEYAFSDHFDELHKMLARYCEQHHCEHHFRSRAFFQGIVAGFESSEHGKYSHPDPLIQLERAAWGG